MNILEISGNSGVYSITNVLNNKKYIGSSIHLLRRAREHRYDLNSNKHYNVKLQRSFNKYGSSSFRFDVLALCPREYLIKLEQWFIDNLKPFFNVNPLAYATSVTHISQEGRKRLSDSRTGTKNVNAKLSVDEVLAIREDTGTCKVLGVKYGISGSQVCLVKNYKSYKNIA